MSSIFGKQIFWVSLLAAAAVISTITVLALYLSPADETAAITEFPITTQTPITPPSTEASTPPITESPTQPTTQPSTENPTPPSTPPPTAPPTPSPTEPPTPPPTAPPTPQPTEAPTPPPTEPPTPPPTEPTSLPASTEPPATLPTAPPTRPTDRPSTEPPIDSFPDDFLFGSASASYQIEGAWKNDGKGENIWDRATHERPDLIAGNLKNGDVSANSYELYKEDVKALKLTGVNFYRFSISWARILPNGDLSIINENGLRYYDNLIDELLANDIEPMITMYHWDLPQKLQEIGGMANVYLVDYFVEYARVLLNKYNSKVKFWGTFNEPSVFCVLGYGTGEHAPLTYSPGVGDYMCGHTVLLANARVYRLYKEEYQPKNPLGKMGIVLNSDYTFPKNPNSLADIEQANRTIQFHLGWFAHPIFSKEGGYPKIMTDVIDANSKSEGREFSRLPELTKEEIDLVRGSADFMGLNYYSGEYGEPGNNVDFEAHPNPSFERDQHTRKSVDPQWPQAKSSWLRSVPSGLRQILNWIKNQYDNPEVIITENGWSDDGDIYDADRIDYIQGHLQAVLDAVRKDSCNVTGYTYWSVIDNFEWMMGYTERFGMFHVDYNRPDKIRIPKDSVSYYREIIQTKKIPPTPMKIPVDEFPEEFIFGSASASYQVEGGWDADGKGENIWDRLTHTSPEKIAGYINTGDIGPNSYELYKEDVKALKEAGVHFYRFSISWARILPNGDLSVINEKGLQYYDNLIDELILNNIQPMVTMYHWDLPQKLEDIGGMTNRSIVNYFVDYSKILLDRYSNRVKYWATFNEPIIFCEYGYGRGINAPMRYNPGIGEYLCSHHVLLAHAQVYRIYKADYFSKNPGKMGIVLNSGHNWPKDGNKQADVIAADRSTQFWLGWYAHPIFSKDGGYPQIMIDVVNANSANENRTQSRLPVFTETELTNIKGSADFFGLNYYSSNYAEPGSDLNWAPNPSFFRDQYIQSTTDDSWPTAKSSWLKSVPDGLRAMLNWIRREYDNPEVIITENGWSDDGEIYDTGRIAYMTGHLKAVLDAVRIDKCRVTGYTYWSIIDNFEWMQGFTERFGMYHVDIIGLKKTRTAKDSVGVYRKIIETRKIPALETTYSLDIFPEDFMFGTASSSYQIEGGWNADGKGENIWDRITHTHANEVGGAIKNGDIAANSYEFYMEDVKALKEVGVNHYRFSISWARVMPDGDISSLNEKGLQYYDNLINALVEAGIEPMVTMYHWDLPQKLQDLGGMPNRLIVDYFVEYARVLLDRFADRVRYWNTFNEAVIFCEYGHGRGVHAPMVHAPGIAEYWCSHHVLLANARVYRMYKKDYAHYPGKMGLVSNCGHTWPRDPNNATHIDAADRSLQYWLGWYTHPIFSKKGDYPPVMIREIKENSINENRTRSRLPEFTPEEIELVRGTSDFLGLNYYSFNFAEPAFDLSWAPNPSFFRDQNVHQTDGATWPEYNGLRGLLNWIRREYDNPEVIITENGAVDNVALYDMGRIEYIRTHLKAVLDAVKLDKCRVTGYTYWSLIDNFEWMGGYTVRLGLYDVDFESPRKTRAARDSAKFYATAIQTRKVPPYPTRAITDTFPKEFLFGAASAAYQVEGAYNADGKGENIWDRLTHTFPEKIAGNIKTGDIAANSYENYKEDVKALKMTGVQFYRFSISWARVLPDGDISSKNEKGLQYYDNLIDELKANDIEPMVTMYHWDLPQKLQEIGGLLNRYIIDYFEQYAKLLFERYGDRVKFWNTFNEPVIFCESGHGRGTQAPMVYAPGVGEYLCAHNVLLAHARVYKLYKQDYFPKNNGKLGIVLNSGHTWPKDPNQNEHVEAADRSLQFWLGWYAHPIYSKNGGYPQIMIDVINENSKNESRQWSRLPEFSNQEINYIRGSADFFGLNYYTSNYAEPGYDLSWAPNPGFHRDQNIQTTTSDSWPTAKSTWLKSVPSGLRALLKWIRREYDNPEVIITANGWSDDGQLLDTGRIDYLKGHLRAVLDAIHFDHCNVSGYTHWSIIDNFEWLQGYTERFGLFRVDFNSANRTRTPKESANTYRQIIDSRKIPK